MRLLWAAVLAAAATAAQAGASSPRFCDQAQPLEARTQDRLLRMAAVVHEQLEASGQAVALVARSGLDLARFGLRYSHAGVSLKASANAPWSVRQLYYACDEGRPRLFDQGMAGFVLGSDDPAVGYVSIVLLPADAAARLEQAALDNARALRLLAGRYSANAFAFSLRYQNCNQWVMELLAAAWGDLTEGDDLRARAQRWLAGHGYDPQPVEVGSHALMFAGSFVPWIHYDDHPLDDRYALHFRTSVPRTIESFVHHRLPGAQRIEVCHDAQQIVVHRGWTPVGEGCVAAGDDTVLPLQ